MKEIYDDITQLFNGIEDLSIENTNLKRSLDRLRKNLTNRSEVTSLVMIRSQMKTNMAIATDAPSTVVLTDRNWGALNSSVKLLGDLSIANSEVLRNLITAQQMKEYLEEQIQNLQSDVNATESNVDGMLTTMQETLNSQSDRLKTQTEESIRAISSQAGRAKENISSAFSEMRDDMKRWLKKIMWIALIPSGLVFFLELLRLILSAVLHG